MLTTLYSAGFLLTSQTTRTIQTRYVGCPTPTTTHLTKACHPMATLHTAVSGHILLHAIHTVGSSQQPEWGVRGIPS